MSRHYKEHDNKHKKDKHHRRRSSSSSSSSSSSKGKHKKEHNSHYYPTSGHSHHSNQHYPKSDHSNQHYSASGHPVAATPHFYPNNVSPIPAPAYYATPPAFAPTAFPQEPLAVRNAGDTASGTWQCSKCGFFKNNSTTCMACGNMRPQEKIPWATAMPVATNPQHDIPMATAVPTQYYNPSSTAHPSAPPKYDY